jgi:transcriptional regulator with XRE-family HTH domain
MNRIKLLREERGWTQAQLGKMLNVKDSAISKYETEKIPLTADTLKLLSEIFGVSVDYIMGISSVRDPAGTSFSKPSILDDLSPEAREKAEEYVEMLKKLDDIESCENLVDFRKES